ncbi:hypothetical protein MD588_02740 [Photobacterium sp. SDRW27]|uniref:hypothetical protein n=1 Tax=Photobacterium obscurum TaxID=2829490 RepID=UPI0022445BC4|nr:hypothetical protein [Photobacterium obscurum]MCW8327711.1 hypothetical protein [Photobacterium obscurum]
MSFSDHLDNFIKQRDKQPQGASKPAYQRKSFVQEPTNQSVAREAIAKAQEDASKQASIDTKAPHVRINGRCVTESEAQTVDQMKVDSKPANPDRIDYIKQLRKELKLKKRSS